MKTQQRAALQLSPPRVSPGLTKLFAAYARFYLRRHFHSLRILKTGMPRLDYRPLIIYLNHASWWDPLVCLLLARSFLPDRRSFAPIDAAMFERYRFFRHLGFFPLERTSGRGALRFLRNSHAIIASSGNALWITPQGQFVDVRERPLRFQDGLGILAASETAAAFVPLAVEYTFWQEPRPEILVSFGEPSIPATQPGHSGTEWTAMLSQKLEEAQDHLAERACRHQPTDWFPLVSGKSGQPKIYDAWRRLRSKLRSREAMSKQHAS